MLARYFRLVAAAVLLCTARLAAAASREDLAARAAKAPHGIIPLDDFSFKDVLDGPRDFYIVALLTCTEPGVGCSACFEFNPVFDAIAESWVRDHADGVSSDDPAKALYFAKADLEDAQAVPEIFKFYSIERVPRLMFFTPDGSIHDYHLLNLPQQKSYAGAAEFITNLKMAVGISDYNVYQPRDWSTVIIAAFVGFTVVYLGRKHSAAVSAVLTSRYVWALAACAFITLMSGGYMYNKMRGTPMAGADNDGNVIYFWPAEFQNQYGIESQIVSVIYALLSATFVGLVVGVPKLEKFYQGSASGATVVAGIVAVLLLVTYVLFAGLTNLFAIKSPRYPFELVKISALLAGL
ncbi:dolichyl-diphosphooligosaccharide--protein glycotransferase [Maudiozyma humilis]|uniref:Dolichyl-diphosphooligosaccharide--protein glycotransferase n=1 Tax=Maudiozyma humilis TaxID=51915 RepID=A0AAV5S177_MAUHU|nr:dolichyl-diphosphooligosaccharide--protein glycotransferase [Kazachstania humilis]